MYRATAERAFERFSKGDSFVAEGYAHQYSYTRDGQQIEGEEFVAKEIGHDTTRTHYQVDRTPHSPAERETPGRDVSAFEALHRGQTTPSATGMGL